MCTFARTVFMCNHYNWGSRLKQCNRAPKDEDGKDSAPCKFKMPHGIVSRRVGNKCGRCRKMDENITYVKEELAKCKEILKRMDEREKEWEMKSKGKGVQVEGEEEDVNGLLGKVALEAATDETITPIETHEELNESDVASDASLPDVADPEDLGKDIPSATQEELDELEIPSDASVSGVSEETPTVEMLESIPEGLEDSEEDFASETAKGVSEKDVFVKDISEEDLVIDEGISLEEMTAQINAVSF